jgi:hypothetical protein
MPTSGPPARPDDRRMGVPTLRTTHHMGQHHTGQHHSARPSREVRAGQHTVSPAHPETRGWVSGAEHDRTGLPPQNLNAREHASNATQTLPRLRPTHHQHQMPDLPHHGTTDTTQPARPRLRHPTRPQTPGTTDTSPSQPHTMLALRTPHRMGGSPTPPRILLSTPHHPRQNRPTSPHTPTMQPQSRTTQPVTPHHTPTHTPATPRG